MKTQATASFKSFFLGGWECSTHRGLDGRRLDVIGATRHDFLAATDYRRLAEFGIRTVRDGLRWHLIETASGQYDFSSVLPMVRAAQNTGTQVIWDLFHYGWPEDLDLFSSEFVHRFAKFARAFALLLREETDEIPFFSPVNEISFVAWAGGDAAFINPFAKGRAGDIKRQLVRATIAAIDEIRNVSPRARFVQCEPAIHIFSNPELVNSEERARVCDLAQYEALDMLTGRYEPELGGGREYVDIVGLNYYSNNQWIDKGPTIFAFHPRYRPLFRVLEEFHTRYERPLLVAETGIEADHRAPWFGYICAEVVAALDMGLPIEGVCLYPIADHPGWSNDRHCPNGLLGYPDQNGYRPAYVPLARELERQQVMFEHAKKYEIAV